MGSDSVFSGRQYLLGQASEQERSALEEQYFADPSVVDRISAIEDDLIEDYLAGRLPSGDRADFERHYLNTPEHRTRVDVVRRVMATRRATKGWATAPSSWKPLALAASVLLAVGLWGAWTAIKHQQPATDARIGVAPAPAAPQTAPPPVPATPGHVFALSISPATVRGAQDIEPLVIPPGTDVVRVTLEADPADRSDLERPRAVVRTVDGKEVWRGDAAIAAANVRATSIDVPAARLPADDYIILLSGSDKNGVERERNRYFLRVRSKP
jgi:hypothetical protein